MKNQLKNEYEHKYWPKLIMGIDEAGRGPLCGPLCVAGLVLPPFYQNENINDSKKLSAKKRNDLYHEIVSVAYFYKVIFVSPREIDELNIYQATKKAMTSLALSYKVDIVLTDALPLNIDLTTISIIKGDALSISIAGASILAKVERDNYMLNLAKIYPMYGYQNHKGYPTKAHLDAIEKYGINKHYRLSYKPCQKFIKK